MVRLAIFGFIAFIGVGCFIAAVFFLTLGHNAEWVTLFLAPVSGVCLATVMHFANIDIQFRISFVVKDGRLSLQFSQS